MHILSERWQQSKGMNTLKLEQPAAVNIKQELHSAEKLSQKSAESSKRIPLKKELIRDFDLADDEEVDDKPA